MDSIAGPFGWSVFLVVVLGLLALDLGVFHRKSHTLSFREAMTWSGVWIGLATLFAGGIWWASGAERALEFTSAYVIEKALSVDNIFVILVVMQSFAVPEKERHRVLFWGVVGALVMRAIFIVAGAALIARFHAVLYVFGVILVLTGLKLFAQGEAKPDPSKSFLVRLLRRVMPVTSEYRGSAFTVVEHGRRVATPLLAALLAIEGADLVFAVDSIPAVFAVSQDVFIVFTSNVLAILGLRSLFFVLAGALERFTLLKYGLGGVLLFVGVKMLLIDVVKVPTLASLGVIGALLALSMLASAWVDRRARLAVNAG
jgi:tellurite resistance protein TerC